MKTRFCFIALALLVTGLIQVEPAYAVRANLTASVVRVLVIDPTYYGGCMAELNTPLSATVPAVNCPEDWVTFSCNGTYIGKDIAFYMLEQAQLALSLNKRVFVTVDDSKKHNGYCFANRIDVFK